MNQPSKSADPKPPRPFSLRPQDFGAPSESPRTESTQTLGKEAQEKQEPSSERRSTHEGPKACAGRASTQSQRLGVPPEGDEAPSEDHTILMAVPPPAQENKGG